MDNIDTQTSTCSNQLSCLGPELRPAAAKCLSDDFGSDPYSLQGYRKCDRFAQGKLNTRASRVNRQRKATRNSRRWMLESQDGVELARSNARLPSDGNRLKPRLKRQEAFRVPKPVFTSDFVEYDSDLYRLGLLYDDDHARGSGFNLDAIVRSEPLYAVRPSKRLRKSYPTGCIDNTCLPLDLSFSSLVDDLALAQFLAFEIDKECDPVDEAATRGCPDDDIVPALTTLSTPLHVIYELFEDSTHSLAPPPAVDVFPDLVSDLEGEEDDNNDWDLLPLLQREESDTEAEVVAAEDDAGAATEAWIILGET